MTTIPRILIVHPGEQGDYIHQLKEFLLEQFPALEEAPHHITTIDIDLLYRWLITDKEPCDILIATEGTNVLEVEKTLRELKRRDRSIVIGKVILPKFKLVRIKLKDWQFTSDS